MNVMSTAEAKAVRRPQWSALVGWQRLLLVLLIGYSLAHLTYSICRYNIFAGGGSGDFHRAFYEAEAWRQTGALSLESVLHPPLYYLILRPFTHLEFRSVAYLFYFAQFLLFPLAVILLVKAVSPAQKPTALEYLIAGVLTVNFQPFLETLAMHKVEGIEFVLICAVIYCFRKRRDVLTGMLVFLAANLKYLPGMLAVYFILKRESRVVKGLLVALLLYLLILLPVCGVQGLWVYGIRYPLAMVLEHKHEGTLPEAGMEFQTLTGTVNRWFAGTGVMALHFRTQAYQPVLHAWWAFVIAGLLKVILGSCYLLRIRKAWRVSQREAQWPFYQLELSLTLLLIFVMSPASRVHYAILLLPAFVSTALLWYHHPWVFRWKERVLFVLAYALTAWILPGGLLNRLPPHPLWGEKYSYAYLWFSLPFYGYLLLGWCIVLCDSRLKRVMRPSPP
ncbi:MAG: DUF2029 domain-containing protein [Candidatus Omnitrophica bacterium]|nr:DUF2029 domain-containing protein [Candidatus Omnitrophota bacterium]